MADLMEKMVDFVISTQYKDLSADVVTYAKNHLLDTIGIIAAGSSSEGINAMVELANEWGGKEEATIPLYGFKVPVPSAAYAIGPMARAWDFGGVHPDANEHTTEYVLPAVLPVAEKLRCSGKDLILAVALGNEIISRIGASVHTITGVSMARTHSVFRIWGPVIAVGKLLGLSKPEIIDAIGLSYTQGGCDNKMFVDGVLKIRAQHGLVADTAIKCVYMAQRGITGTKKVLEGEKGFYEAFYPRYDVSWILNGLEEKNFIATKTIIKGYPTCTYTHSSIETALECIIENDIQPEEIKEVKVGVNTPTYELVALPLETRYHPITPADAQFSIPYSVACAVVNRKVFIDDYLDKALKRQEIQAMTQKVMVEVDPDIEKTDPVGFAGAKVLVITKNGKKYDKRIDHVKGTPQNPMSSEELEKKFRGCINFSVNKLAETNIDNIIDKFRNLEDETDVSQLVKLLCP
jgi:2-methylcitrate dehydratase PrpD